MKSAMVRLKRITCSRLGLLFAFVHLCLVIFAFAQKETAKVNCDGALPGGWLNVYEVAGNIFVAGRMVHFYYEATLFKIIYVLDLPGMLLSFLVAFPFSFLSYLFPKLCAYTQSWLLAAALIIGTSIQWWLIGYLLEQLTKAKSRGRVQQL